AWTNTQKATFVRACKAAGIPDEHRRLILGQCDGRAVHQGKVTSTSPRLNQPDFDHCMATVETSCGGQIPRKRGSDQPWYKAGYWQQQADIGDTQRLRWIAQQIHTQLKQRCTSWTDASLRGWIHDRVTNGQHGDLDRLTHRQVSDLVHGLRAWASRHSIDLAA
ncbi:MAG: hypothetical protein ACODAQ_12180, partial [Phycisphaeraceae bacterium]